MPFNQSQLPDDFLRAISDMTEAVKIHTAALEDASKASEREAKDAEKGGGGLAGKLRNIVGGAAIGAVANAAREGLVTSNTTTATFGQGFVNSIEGLYAQGTGRGLNQRNAIAQGGQDTFSFFAEAAAAGAQIDDRTLNQIRDFNQTRRERQAALQERIGGETVRRQNDAVAEGRGKVIEDFFGQIGQDIKEIRNAIERVSGGGGN